MSCTGFFKFLWCSSGESVRACDQLIVARVQSPKQWGNVGTMQPVNRRKLLTVQYMHCSKKNLKQVLLGRNSTVERCGGGLFGDSEENNNLCCYTWHIIVVSLTSVPVYLSECHCYIASAYSSLNRWLHFSVSKLAKTSLFCQSITPYYSITWHGIIALALYSH